MKTHKACALILLLLALAFTASGHDSWRAKPPSAWSEKEVRKILEDSPWSHRQRLIITHMTVSSPGVGAPQVRDSNPIPNGTSASTNPQRRSAPSIADQPALNAARSSDVAPPREFSILGLSVVRWASARIISEAVLRHRVLQGAITAEQAGHIAPYSSQDSYVVYVDLRVSLRDVDLIPRGGVLTPAMVWNSTLYVETTRERIQPSVVRLAPLPEFDDRKELALAAYYIFFPRQAGSRRLLARGNSRVRFECPLVPVPIRHDFDLRKMAHDGSSDF